MDCILLLLLLRKGDLGFTQNYRGITLTAKFYNILLFNCIQPEIKILRKIRMAFRIDPQPHKF